MSKPVRVAELLPEFERAGSVDSGFPIAAYLTRILEEKGSSFAGIVARQACPCPWHDGDRQERGDQPDAPPSKALSPESAPRFDR